MEVGGAANSMLLLPLKSRFDAVLMLFCGFFDCIVKSRSNAELYLLLPEHRGEKCSEAADFLVVVLVVMLVLLVVAMLLMPLVMMLAIFGYRKKRKTTSLCCYR